MYNFFGKSLKLITYNLFWSTCSIIIFGIMLAPTFVLSNDSSTMVSLGYNFARMSYSTEDWAVAELNGFQQPPLQCYSIGIEGSSGMDGYTGVTYTQRGYTYNFSTLLDDNYTINYEGEYLERFHYLTTYLIWDLAPNSSSKLKFYAGVELSYLIADIEIEGESTQSIQYNNGVTEEIQSSLDETIDIYDWGDSGGALYDIGALLSVRYEVSPLLHLSASYYGGILSTHYDESVYHSGVKLAFSINPGAKPVQKKQNTSSKQAGRPPKTPVYVDDYYEFRLYNGDVFKGVKINTYKDQRMINGNYYIYNSEKGDFILKEDSIDRIKFKFQDDRKPIYGMLQKFESEIFTIRLLDGNIKGIKVNDFSDNQLFYLKDDNVEFGKIKRFTKAMRNSYIIINREVPNPNMRFIPPTWERQKIRIDCSEPDCLKKETLLPNKLEKKKYNP